jgi:glutathione S-transferase
MQGAHLTYYAGRGHGERVRYALAAAAVPYSESYLQRAGDLDALCLRCLFGQAPLFVANGVRFVQSPLLEVDGLRLSHSWAAVRYLAQKNDLTPRSPAGVAKADAVAEQARDFSGAGGFTAFGWASGFFDSREVRDASLAAVAGAAAHFLPTFEAAVEQGGFVTGAAPCWAGARVAAPPPPPASPSSRSSASNSHSHPLQQTSNCFIYSTIPRSCCRGPWRRTRGYRSCAPRSTATSA